MADEVLGDVLVTLPAVDIGEGEAEAVASGERQDGSQEREPEQQYEHRLTEKNSSLRACVCVRGGEQYEHRLTEKNSNPQVEL